MSLYFGARGAEAQRHLSLQMPVTEVAQNVDRRSFRSRRRGTALAGNRLSERDDAYSKGGFMIADDQTSTCHICRKVLRISPPLQSASVDSAPSACFEAACDGHRSV